MAKDPAVLFYTQDFLIGVSLLSPLQKGHYITLLCYQQQSETGSLSISQVQTLMGRDFKTQWPFIKMKFKEDEAGFYNERMRKEIGRRKQFADKQKDKVVKRWADKKHTEIDTGVYTPEHAAVDTTVLPNNGNTFLETEIEIEIKAVREGVQGEIDNPAHKPTEVFGFDQELPLPALALEAAEMNQFTMTRKRNTEFVQAQWIVFLCERLNDPQEKLRQYKQISDLTSYFLNWLRNKKPIDGTNESGAGKTGKSAGANRLLAKTIGLINASGKHNPGS